MRNRKRNGILAAAIAILVVLLLSSAEQEERKVPEPQSEQARVTQVIDGDTLIATINGREHKVRLLGVDAAELERDDEIRTTKRECYAVEAKAALEDLVLNTSVTLLPDPHNENADEYGRLLRYIYLPTQTGLSDDTLINHSLIAKGHTRFLSFFPLSPDIHTTFETAEHTARTQNLGLWAVCPA